MDTTTIVPVTPTEPVRLIRILNPFDPRKQERVDLPWEQLKPVDEYFPTLQGHEEQFIVALDGKIVPPDEYKLTYPARGSTLVLSPVIAGGGGDSKSVLRIVAFVALAIVAGPIAQLALGAMGVAATGTALAIMTAGITVIGGMLINALLPVQQPKQQKIDSSPTYGIDGPKNTNAQGIPVPVIYGIRRVAGNLVGIYTKNIDRETQYLYMLFAAAEGEVAGIDSIYINDQPAGNWDNLEVDTRLGTASQTTIGWFNDTVTAKYLGQTLTTSQYVNYTTEVEVDNLRLDFLFPGGLFYQDDGKYRNFTARLSMEYSPAGQNNWTAFGGQASTRKTYWVNGVKYYTFPAGYHCVCKTYYSYGDNDGYNEDWCTTSAPVGATIYSNTPQQQWYGGDWEQASYTAVGYVGSEAYWDTSNTTITAMWITPSRVSYETGPIPEGYYDIRVKRLDTEETGPYKYNVVTLQDVNEIRVEDIAYRHTALVALSIRLSEQLNGIPKVSYLVRGKKVRVWNFTTKAWEVKYSPLPCWQVLDMMTNTRYGGGIPDSRIDLESFKRWALHCAEQGLESHIAIDVQTNLWDAMRPLLRAGHAEIIMTGTRYSIAVEKADDPVMLFNVTNIVKGSFSSNWLPMAERANAVEITYFDKADEYKQATVKVYDPGFDENTPERVAEVTLHAVTDRARAMREAEFQLNLNRYVTQTCTFEAPIEAIACTIGDLIYVQHDMPFWSYGGRLKSGSTTTSINLDRPIYMDYGREYALMVVYDQITRFSGTVASVSGNTVYLNGFTAVGEVHRLKIGANEYAVRDVVTSPSNGVVLDSTAGISGGQAYTLIETDAMEERNVLFSAGEFSTVTLSSPLPSAPVALQKFMFGEKNILKKPFRVRSISGDSEFKRTITALEYNASVYDLNVPDADTPNYSTLRTAVDHVTITGVTETLEKSGNTIVTNVIVEFTGNSEWYRGSRIYVRTNGGPERLIGSGQYQYSFVAGDGSDLVIRVVAYDVMGVSASRATAPTIAHTVIGKMAPPADVTGFNSTVMLGGIRLRWTANTEVDLKGYEIRQGASWDAGTVLQRGITGTELFVPVDQAGTYKYHIKAIDTSNNYSVNAALVENALVAPAQVRGFVAVQNGNVINLRWRPNTELGLIGYEIREGQTWNSGRSLGLFNATNATVPQDNTNVVRTFWIKSKVIPGVYCDVAVFANTATAELPDRNVVYTSDQHALSYPGHRINTELLGQDLVLTAGAEYGEYVFLIDLLSQFRAHNFLDLAFDSILVDTETWAGITYKWSDTQAQRWWIQLGNDSEIAIDTEIALFDGGYQPGEIIGWTFDNTLNTLTGVAPNASANTSYQSGRYHNGLYVGDTTTADWTIAGGSTTEWTWSFWVKPSDVTGDRVYGVLYHATASRFIKVGYNGTLDEIYCIDDLGNRLAIPVTLVVNDHVCIAVSQNATGRTLFAGVLGQTSPLTPASGAYVPTGAFNKYRVNP